MGRSLLAAVCLLFLAGCTIMRHEIGLPYIATFEWIEIKPVWAEEPIVLSSWSLKPGWQNATAAAGAAIGSLAAVALWLSVRRRGPRRNGGDSPITKKEGR